MSGLMDYFAAHPLFGQPYGVHILDVPKPMRRRCGATAVVELPECMGSDVRLTVRRDRLLAYSESSNVVVMLTAPSEMPADCG